MHHLCVIILLLYILKTASAILQSYASTDELCQHCLCAILKNDKLEVSCFQKEMGGMPNFSGNYLDTNVTRYNVESSGIKFIEKTHLKAFPNLEKLKLYDNDIAEIPEDLLENTRKLKTIRLRKNKIKFIPVSLFKWTPNIRYVSFAENGIVELNKNTFSGLKKLRKVWFYQNDIEYLPKDLFKDNVELEFVLFGSSNLSLEIINRDQNLTRPTNVTTQVVDKEDTTVWRHRHNYISQLPYNLFESTRVLEKVSFSMNQIEYIPDGFFQNTSKIRELYLYGNRITELHQQVFANVTNLEILDLSLNQIKQLKSGMFLQNNKLRRLNLSGNNLAEIKSDSFDGLGQLRQLDISTMYSIDIDWRFLEKLPRLRTLYTTNFFDCCFAKVHLPGLRCVTPGVAISSCSNLIRSPHLRVLVWVNFILAIGCNLLAIILRSMTQRGERDCGQNILVVNLAVSDLLMGVYLAIIASMDLKWRHSYFKHDREWRHSNLCQFTGLLSFLSSQISVFTLGVITYFRYMAIVHSLHYSKSLSRSMAFKIIVSIWTIALTITLPPLVFTSYFTDHVTNTGFYGNNGVCIPLQLPGKRSKAWEYSLAIFGILNLILCVHMAASYVRMFVATFRSPKTPRSSLMKEEIAIAVRFFVVVFTDICCWLPVSILMILSLFDKVDANNSEVYAWFAICVIPINSTLNPLVYTLTAPRVLKTFKSFSNALQLSLSDKGAE